MAGRKNDKRTLLVRVVCIVLAVLMVGSVLVAAITAF